MWVKVTIGGIDFRETVNASEASGQLTLNGQESFPPQTEEFVRATHLNMLGLIGKTIQVVARDKVELTGFYVVNDATSSYTDELNGEVVAIDWQLRLSRIGGERDVEFESVVPEIARSTELAGQTPVFWHAPPIGTLDYYTGATVPSGTVTRQSADGPIAVFTHTAALPSYPRWTVRAVNYDEGAVKLTLDGQRRLGDLTTPGHSTWSVDNGLVQVTGGSSPNLTVSVWDGGAWSAAKAYVPQVNGVSLTATPDLVILRNDPEQVVVRLEYPQLPGRVTVDISLRRGSRTLNGVMKRHAAATLGIARTAAEAASAVTGGIRATANDADGNRFVMGSSKVTTNVLTTASISDLAVTIFDFFLGAELNGTTAQAGDTFADLLSQYLGTTGDRTRAVSR
jgi:hypothetical protein